MNGFQKQNQKHITMLLLYKKRKALLSFSCPPCVFFCGWLRAAYKSGKVISLSHSYSCVFLSPLFFFFVYVKFLGLFIAYCYEMKKKIFMWLLPVDVAISHGRVFVTLCPHFQDVVRTICSSPLGEVYYHTTISLYYILCLC